MSPIVHRAVMLKPIVCLIGCTISAITWSPAGPGWTQTIGDEAELDRLQVKAEDAMASDDPEGAAMAMGRAAMMAKRLSLVNRNDGTSARLYQGAESLFRFPGTRLSGHGPIQAGGRATAGILRGLRQPGIGSRQCPACAHRSGTRFRPTNSSCRTCEALA